MSCNFTHFLGLPAVSPLVFLLTNKEPEARRGPAKKGRTNKEDCRLLNLSPLSLKLLVTRARVLVHNTHMSECVERLLQPLLSRKEKFELVQHAWATVVRGHVCKR